MSVFGANSGFGAITGWDLQSTSETVVSERAQAFGKTGNESDSELYDKRTNVTSTYKAKANYSVAAPTVPAAIGALLNSRLLLSIQLNTTFNGFVTMTLTGHKHEDGTDGSDLRSIAHGISLTKGFGANEFGLTSGLSGDSTMESSVTISCDHEEVKDANGDTSQGENHNPRIEASITRLGAMGTNTAPSGYDLVSEEPKTENTGFNSFTVQLYKALAFAE